MSTARARFLFDPVEVRQMLEGFPSLHGGLADPNREGEKSDSFPAARKSERQIYRVLANLHYPHLRTLVETLDFCIAGGFTQPKLLSTRAHGEFGSALSELRTAKYFLRRGFSVASRRLAGSTGC